MTTPIIFSGKLDHIGPAHSLSDGDNCDCWGNVLPIYAAQSQAAAADPARLTNYTPSTNPTQNPADAVTVGLNPSPNPAPVAAAAITVNPKKEPLLKRAISVSRVSRPSSAAHAEREVKRIDFKAQEHMTMLEEVGKAATALMHSTTSPEVAQEAARRRAFVESPAAKDLARAICSQQREAVRPLYELVMEAGNNVLIVLDEFAVEAKQAETAMFEEFGLPWEPTILTRRVQALRHHLQTALSAVKMPENTHWTDARPVNVDLFNHFLDLVSP